MKECLPHSSPATSGLIPLPRSQAPIAAPRTVSPFPSKTAGVRVSSSPQPSPAVGPAKLSSVHAQRQPIPEEMPSVWGWTTPRLLCSRLSCYGAGLLAPRLLDSHQPFILQCPKHSLEDKHSQMTVR